MKPSFHSWCGPLVSTVLVCGMCVTYAASLPSDWERVQTLEIPSAGLVKVSLPVETLDAARAGLEDLRVYDDNGNELPYFVERPTPATKLSRNAASFHATLNARDTVLTFETGMSQPIDAVTLETPAISFIKRVKIEISEDGREWTTVAQGLPIFRQPSGASQLRLKLPVEVRGSLRLTVDDQRSPPIPFTDAVVHAASAEPTPIEPLSASITERHENPGETRLSLNLGAANLDIVRVELQTDEPLFTRKVTMAVPQVMEDGIGEQIIGHGTIFRVALDGQVSVASLSVELEDRVRSRELILLIKNDDSPPLAISAVHVERRPVYLVFMAKTAGTCHLLVGNPHCRAPRYDLAALEANLKPRQPSPLRLGPLSRNPNYRSPEALADVELTGNVLDVSPWRYRKALKLLQTGAQQLELDLEVLAHAQSSFADLRLMRGDKQVPYVLEKTSITRTLTPTVTATNDAKDLGRSWWTIKLPQPNLPLTRLSCASRSPLFERTMVLFEEVASERGDKTRHHLGSATWIQTPERKAKELVLTFDSQPFSDTLLLTTVHGDNPAIELENLRLFYPATRILFKSKPDDDLLLYYGRADISPPRYDLSLVANQLLAATKSTATLLAEQQLRKSPWTEGRAGKGGVVLWSILAVVVVGLLFIISRLLPKSAA